MPNPEELSFNDIVKAIKELPLRQHRLLCEQLGNEFWGDDWDALATEIRIRNKDLPPLTGEEIFAVMDEE